MILYTHNNKLIKIRSGLNAGKLIEKYVEPPPSFDQVTIGTQTWMAKNLAIDDSQGGIYTHTVNYGQGDVVEYYYNHRAAVRVAESIPGWHLPTAVEWDTLINFVGGSSTGGKVLKSTYGWFSPESDRNGTDDYGFAVFPAGYWYNGFETDSKTEAFFWTGTDYSAYSSYYRSFSTESRVSSNRKAYEYGYSVRLIKDS